MKKICAVLTMLLAATAFGCKEAAAPKSEVRIESASDATRNDSRAIAGRFAEQKAAADEAFEKGHAREARQRNVDTLRAIGSRWNDALNEATRTGRSDIAGPIKKLQAIKSEADTVEVDDCTGNARTTLQSAMTVFIDAFSTFQKETGNSGEATTQKAQQGTDLLRTAQQEMEACLTK